MASNKLTKDRVSRLKAREKTYRVADGEGLYLQVEPNGGLYWRLAYRFFDQEKKRAVQRTLAFGKWPDVDIITARKKREAAKDELRAGRDPGASFKGIKFGGVTFGELAAEVLAKMEREKRAESTLKKNRWLLQDLAAPLKDEPLADLDAPTIQALLEQVEHTGRYETAIRLRGAIGGVFRHAIRTARAETDPTLALAGGLTQPPVKHYAAVTEPKAVGRLLLAVESVSGARTVALAMKLLPLVFVRPGELRGMDWSELDRRGKRWVIPAERTKSRREHIVPLSAQALAIFDELQKLTGPTGFVFPNGRTATKCMSEGALAAALASIGYDSTIHTPHGWRSTASTILNESGEFAADVIEIQLAHLHADKVRAIYARGQHWPERVRMMTWYANELDRLRKRARQSVRFGLEA